MQEIADVYHFFGEDIRVSNTGDLLVASGEDRTRQRIIRRLLTGDGEYIFHNEYGAGLRARIGDTLNVQEMQSLIEGQVILEESVAASPLPVVSLRKIDGGAAATITYFNAEMGIQNGLSFSLTQ